MVAGAIFLLLSLMGIGVADGREEHPEHATVNVDGGSFNVAGLNLGQIDQKMSAEDLRELGDGLDISPAHGLELALHRAGVRRVLLLPGRLYDDRKDRSMLFWKSLPVSDTQTVLSKVASARWWPRPWLSIAAIATCSASC